MFPDAAIVTYPLFKEALLTLAAVRTPIWAFAFRLNSVSIPGSYPGGVQGSRSEKLPMIASDPTFSESIFHAPWMASLSAPLAAGVEVPSGILAEHTEDGGLLMIATTDRLDPENAEHRRRARFLVEIMLARTGYPPTTRPNVAAAGPVSRASSARPMEWVRRRAPLAAPPLG